MQTTLKDIFRPARKRLMWTVVLGLPITLLGLHVAGKGAVHSPPLLLVAFVCLLPTVLAGWLWEQLSFLAHPGPVTVVLMSVLQFLYFYALVSLASFVTRKTREGA